MRTPIYMTSMPVGPGLTALLATAVLLLAGSAASLHAGEAAGAGNAHALAITTDRPDHAYAVGEPVTWLVTLSGGQPGDPPPAPTYTVTAGTSAVASGTLRFVGGKASVSSRLDHPGILQLTVDLATPHRGEVRCGAAVAWSAITSTVPEAPDFDAFWKRKLTEVAAVPLSPALTEVDSGSPAVQLWTITLDGYRGSHIHGYLARPRGDAPLPAQLQVQYWGVYALRKSEVVGIAAKGWLALDIMAHDLPGDQDDAFYKAADASGRFSVNKGADDPETCYFLRMFLACSRAVDYLAGRRDWNAKTLLVQGGSQGGFQALAAAGLNSKVTAVTVFVPGGCDLAGSLQGRPDGWPQWLAYAQGAAREARIKTVAYYDAKNFAKRIHCPVLVGIGLLDTIASPLGQCAMFNNLTAPKQLVIEPTEGHIGDHAAYKAVQQAWWKTAAAGGKLP